LKVEDLEKSKDEDQQGMPSNGRGVSPGARPGLRRCGKLRNNRVHDTEYDMPIDDDDRPRPKITHQLGQDLTLLSFDEINARVAALEAEIERLKVEAMKKRASRDAASNFFKS
jgi:uncharacterized small protein (DUF1192 family)